MMRDALARDLRDAGAAVILPAEDADPWESLAGLAVEADAVWPVAPESGGLLEKAAALAAASGRPVLASDAGTLAIAGSKSATSRHLAAAGIRVVPSYGDALSLPLAPGGWVMKPDDGAGAEETHFLAHPVPVKPGHVLQPFLPGIPASFSMLAREGEGWLLSCNLQEMEVVDGVFSYRGGIIGGAERYRADWEHLAGAIAAALPGLWGYLGVDLIEGEAGPVVLEINPRLTTSYAGLRDSIGLNPAGLVLDLLDHPLSALIRPLSPRPVTVTVPRPVTVTVPRPGAVAVPR